MNPLQAMFDIHIPNEEYSIAFYKEINK